MTTPTSMPSMAANLGLEDIVIDAYWMFVHDETWGLAGR